MSKQIIVPFGPQHPVLPEPIHLDLVLEDETVVDVIPSIGTSTGVLKARGETRVYLSTSMSLKGPAGSAVSSTVTPTARVSSRS